MNNQSLVLFLLTYSKFYCSITHYVMSVNVGIRTVIIATLYLVSVNFEYFYKAKIYKNIFFPLSLYRPICENDPSLQFETTPQLDEHDVFDFEAPYRGRYIPFAKHPLSLGTYSPAFLLLRNIVIDYNSIIFKNVHFETLFKIVSVLQTLSGFCL